MSGAASVTVHWRPGAAPEAPGALLFVGPDISREELEAIERDRESRNAALEALDIELWEARPAPIPRRSR
jgi:hypothetical protein